jgi:hypothetical protein
VSRSTRRRGCAGQVDRQHVVPGREIQQELAGTESDLDRHGILHALGEIGVVGDPGLGGRSDFTAERSRERL